MGINDFAKLVGVGHSLISNHAGENGPEPSLKFLRKLSKATGTPLTVLLGMSFPEISQELEVDPGADLLARRIMNFEESTRNVLIGVIESLEKRSNND